MRRVLAACAFAVWTCLGIEAALAHDSGFGLARYTASGTLDSAFGNGGVVVIRSPQSSFIANALALQPDGKIVIAGMSSNVSTATLQLAVARYNPDGSPDASFGSAGSSITPVGDGGGQANAITLQPDGMILVAGTAFAHGTADDQFLLARYRPDGSPDSAFGTAGVVITHVGTAASSASALALQSDGRVLVAGTAFSNGPTDDDFALARYSTSGQLDPTFGNGGTVTTDFTAGGTGSRASLDRAGALAIQADGRIILAGFARGEYQSFAVARYSPGGALDSTFGAGGKVQLAVTEPQVFSVVLHPSGDIVLAGSSASGNGATPFTLVRMHADGLPDEAFGAGGVATANFEGSKSGARAVAVQPDEKLIAGGASFGAASAQGAAQPESGFALARYNTDGSRDTSFGISGRAVTPMGDAGAMPLSLAVQSDGKILAAGLVFFQVATPDAPSRISVPLAAGFVLVLAALGFSLKWWRRKKRGLSS